MIENRSAEFGVESSWKFITDYLPDKLGIIGYTLIIMGTIYNLYMCKNKKEMPAVFIFAFVNIIIISKVPHKEARFMLPIIPLLYLMGC